MERDREHHTRGSCAGIEDPVSPEIARLVGWREQIVKGLRRNGLLNLLGVVPCPREVSVPDARNELVSHDHLDGGPPDPKLPARIFRRRDDRTGCYLGLENGGHGLGVARHARPAPRELRRVKGRKVDHRDRNSALVMQKLATHGVGETTKAVLGAAVRRLKRNRAIRQRRAYLHDDAAVARSHSAKSGHGPPHRSKVGHLCGASKLDRRDIRNRGEDCGHRIIDPNIDRTELSFDLVGGALDRFRIGDIGRQCERRSASGLDVFNRRNQPSPPARQ